MSDRYLTSSFDIHGEGIDLIFSYHENELAQSCAARLNSTCEITYWMHNGFLNTNNEKMSKSCGNFSTIREITNLYHPLVWRYLMRSTHYLSITHTNGLNMRLNMFSTLIRQSSMSIRCSFPLLKKK
ncbi:hypothetical protein MKX03_022286 [Papaver bracteatum]|nr:hypothetical protein MKX03_022286 [Papaver bracteatum]